MPLLMRCDCHIAGWYLIPFSRWCIFNILISRGSLNNWICSTPRCTVTAVCTGWNRKLRNIPTGSNWRKPRVARHHHWLGYHGIISQQRTSISCAKTKVRIDEVSWVVGYPTQHLALFDTAQMQRLTLHWPVEYHGTTRYILSVNPPICTDPPPEQPLASVPLHLQGLCLMGWAYVLYHKAPFP